jgi:hypothetical protein
MAMAELTAVLREAGRHAEEVLRADETPREAAAAARQSLCFVARLMAAWRRE